MTIQEAEKYSLRWFRLKVKQLVICDHFTRGILVAILVNTLSMGVEYHQQVCCIDIFYILTFSQNC